MVEGPRGWMMTAAVRDALSAATRRQTEIYTVRDCFAFSYLGVDKILTLWV